jgi:hypothetical protein
MAIEGTFPLATGFVATYARPMSSPSFRFDTGVVDLQVALYKDAAARFAEALPADYDRRTIQLTEDERAAILDVIYSAITREEIYPEGAVRDPDPEKAGV